MAIVNASDQVVPGAPFRWYEFGGWEHATPAQAAALQQHVRTVLWPVRNELGPILISQGGWIWSRYGYPRTDAAHVTGGAVDWVPRDASVLDGYQAARDLPGAPYGELIYEGDHVHSTNPGVGGNAQTLLLTDQGDYIPDPVGPGGVLNLELVYQSVRPGWWAVLALAGGVWLLAHPAPKPRPAS